MVHTGQMIVLWLGFLIFKIGALNLQKADAYLESQNTALHRAQGQGCNCATLSCSGVDSDPCYGDCCLSDTASGDNNKGFAGFGFNPSSSAHSNNPSPEEDLEGEAIAQARAAAERETLSAKKTWFGSSSGTAAPPEEAQEVKPETPEPSVGREIGQTIKGLVGNVLDFIPERKKDCMCNFSCDTHNDGSHCWSTCCGYKDLDCDCMWATAITCRGAKKGHDGSDCGRQCCESAVANGEVLPGVTLGDLQGDLARSVDKVLAGGRPHPR